MNDQKTKVRTRVARWVIVTLAVSLLPTMHRIAHAQDVPMGKVEDALLAEDWIALAGSAPAPEPHRKPGLLDAVSHESKQSPDPVLRWIKGHACLALNRNNESVCLFLSVAGAQDRQKCQGWIDRFASKHAASPVCAYLRGDLLARAKKFGEAIQAYSRVIPLAADEANYPLLSGKKAAVRPLLYNARGVAYALDGQTSEARLDLQVACETPLPYRRGENGASEYLADAFANVGALMIQQKEGAEGAKRAFDTALRISPTFAFASYGRGCIAVVVVDERCQTTADRIAEAGDFFRKAADQAGPARELLVDAHVTFLAESLGLTREELNKLLANQDVAMSLQTSYDQVLGEFNQTGKISQGSANRLISAWRTASPEERARYGTFLKETAANLPGFGRAFQPRVERSIQWNGGVGRFFTLDSWGMSIGAKGIGANVTFGGGRSINEGNLGAASSIRDAIGRPSGVLASLSASLWDNGQWPFRAVYGLSY